MIDYQRFNLLPTCILHLTAIAGGIPVLATGSTKMILHPRVKGIEIIQISGQKLTVELLLAKVVSVVAAENPSKIQSYPDCNNGMRV